MGALTPVQTAVNMTMTLQSCNCIVRRARARPRVAIGNAGCTYNVMYNVMGTSTVAARAGLSVVSDVHDIVTIVQCHGVDNFGPL